MDDRINVLGDSIKSKIINKLQKEETKKIETGDGHETSEILVEDLDPEEIKKESLKKYEKALHGVNLPEVGTEFSINGQIFKITYVNKGRKRLSAEPMV